MVLTTDALAKSLESQLALSRLLTSFELSLASHCPGWSTFDVLNHSIGVTMQFTEFASGVTDTPEHTDGDLIGANPRRAVENVSTASHKAWASVDPERTCVLSFGSFEALFAAGINLVEVLAHSWDMSPVAHHWFECDDEVWATGLDIAHDLIGSTRDPQRYGPQIDVAPSASIEEHFLGYLGRR